MSIVSKLTLPAIVGGLVALVASGVLSPPVFAGNSISDSVARIVEHSNSRHIVLNALPQADAQPTGTLPTRYWIWVERCISDEAAREWCLVERGEQRGWVPASQLQIFRD